MTIGIGMYNQPQTQMYGNMRHKGSVIQNLENQYGCEDCFQKQPYFAEYPIRVQQVPRNEVKPSFWQKIVNTFFGG